MEGPDGGPPRSIPPLAVPSRSKNEDGRPWRIRPIAVMQGQGYGLAFSRRIRQVSRTISPKGPGFAVFEKNGDSAFEDKRIDPATPAGPPPERPPLPVQGGHPAPVVETAIIPPRSRRQETGSEGSWRQMTEALSGSTA